MSNFLNRNINTVFIMLGNSCNLNCEYCLQHPLVDKELSKEINQDIYRFLHSIASSQQQILTLQFYGGEPLVYFDTIKEIVGVTSNMNVKFNYSIISNGKLMDKEKIDFFNRYNFNIAISWDGNSSESTRHYNVFKENPNLYEIKKLSISSVLSSYAYLREILDDKYEVYKKYYGIYNRYPSGCIDIIMDTCLNNKELTNFDFNKLKEECDYIFKNYYLSINEKFDEIDDDYTVAHLYFAQDTINQYNFSNNHISYLPKCGNGFFVLNLDLEGNLYPCHNTSKSIGTIYSSYWDYLSKLLEYDNSLKYIDNCINCEAYTFCHGGCKLVESEPRERYYCQVHKIFAESIKKYSELYKKDNTKTKEEGDN